MLADWRVARCKRLVYLLHRWSSVGACLLMVLWLVSGVVMLFVGYPQLLPQERLQRLPALAQAACCTVPAQQALALSPAPERVQQLVLTTVAHRLVYRVHDEAGRLWTVDALTGQTSAPVDGAQALASARALVPRAQARLEGQTQDDRWSHGGGLDAHRPLFKVQMNDAAQTLLYVSSTTGEVVLDAPRAERAWNYVGAWLHWWYFAREGSKDPVWSWLVIAVSAWATVAALTGALAGLWRWRFVGRYKSGAKTPYRAGALRWHHLTGLVFGLVLLAWVFSGLMSMNPLGLFSPPREQARPDLMAYQQGAAGMAGLVGTDLSAAQALRLLAQQGFEAVEIEWRMLAGRPYLLALDGAGATRLVVEQPMPEPAPSPQQDGAPAQASVQVLERWPEATLVAAGRRLLAAELQSAEVLTAYDRYYYPRQEASMYAAAPRRLPAVRLQFADVGRTLVYLDAATGELALSLDRSQRVGRWLFNLLHSWDLPPLLRWTALREAVLLAVSLGALALAATGCVLAWRRVLLWRQVR
jgi:uncharacterized iron-regulated membrane protein